HGSRQMLEPPLPDPLPRAGRFWTPTAGSWWRGIPFGIRPCRVGNPRSALVSVTFCVQREKCGTRSVGAAEEPISIREPLPNKARTENPTETEIRIYKCPHTRGGSL